MNEYGNNFFLKYIYEKKKQKLNPKVEKKGGEIWIFNFSDTYGVTKSNSIFLKKLDHDLYVHWFWDVPDF